MSTIKQDRKDLEALLNGIAPISTPASSPTPTVAVPQSDASTVIDSAAGTLLTEEKLFDFDVDSVRKGLRKRARKTIMNITKHILPDDMLEEEYIQDKIEQDIETLTDLYMQAESNKIMQASIINSVSRGNTMPRMYEVFGQLTDRISGINKQIVSTEQTIRKTYVDLKYEIRDKQSEDLANSENSLGYTGNSAPKQLEGSVIVTSSKDLNNLAKQKHREALEALENAKETTYTEE